MGKIRSFTDLNAWKEAHKLVLMIYGITKNFPQGEQFGLVTPLCKAAVSVSSNIAEGFGRSTKKEKMRFYEIAQTSLTEVQNQLLIARDVQYVSSAVFQKIAEQTVVTSKLLSGLRKNVPTRK